MKKPNNREITSQLEALSSNLDVLWLTTKNLICQSINALTLSLRGVKSSGVSPFSVWERFWLTVGSEQKKKQKNKKTKQNIINKCTCFADLDQNELLITLIKQGMFFMFFLFPVYNIIPVQKTVFLIAPFIYYLILWMKIEVVLLVSIAGLSDGR